MAGFANVWRPRAAAILDTPKIKSANAKAWVIRDVGVFVFSDGSPHKTAGVHVETVFGEKLAERGAQLAEKEPYATVSQIIALARPRAWAKPIQHLGSGPSSARFRRKSIESKWPAARGKKPTGRRPPRCGTDVQMGLRACAKKT